MSEVEREPSSAREPLGAEEAAEVPASAAPPESSTVPAEADIEPFLQGFPSTPELDRLVAAFRSGNYALVRREARAVADASGDPQVQQAALELRRRIDPDPLARYILLVSAGLLLALVLVAYFHARHG